LQWRQGKDSEGKDSEYYWTNGEYNICKIGSSNGMKYELWNVESKVQLAVNLPSSKAAIEIARQHASAQAKGAA